jgi:hypothetical protein
MGRLVDFFTGKAAPEPVSTAPPTTLPTTGSTTLPTAGSTALPTAEPTSGSEPPEWAPLYFIREAGVIVDLACDPDHMDPAKHALILLHKLMRDDCAGEPATEKALRTYYIAICRKHRIKPFPWLSVIRHFNRLLRFVYGPAYKKTYKRVYGGGRLRQRRVYRIPLLSEFDAAARALEQAQDTSKVA